jgi:hypothetical protein
MLMFYEGLPGEHVSMSAKNAIALAAKYNRKVRLRFNGIALTVSKRLSVKHVVGTWQHMLDARQLRYQNSPAGRAAKAKRAAEIAEKQSKIDLLMMDLPSTKDDASAWIAKWVPLSDDVGVDRRGLLVSHSLRAIGFVSGEHVGAPEFKAGTASRMMRIEYIAGQVISMLESVGCVHPMIGEWAADAAARSAEHQS